MFCRVVSIYFHIPCLKIQKKKKKKKKKTVQNARLLIQRYAQLSFFKNQIQE